MSQPITTDLSAVTYGDVAISKTETELSIVMPCLNEAETLETCISKAQRAMQESNIVGEVVIADNGSTDGSQEIARRLGARVVDVKEKGYGSALKGGIAAARGRYVIMGDADDSYDFLDIPRFLEQLREGHDLVMGNRFKGGIMPGAMPWKHRWIGNPVLTAIGRLFFRCPSGDFHCGLRGFSKSAYDRMGLSTSGMEFASEMVIKSTLMDLKITEIPTVLRPDGRTRAPHLRSWRDGWRHLRFMLLFSPRWLFLMPGALLFVLGAIVFGLLLGGPRYIGSIGFDIHTMHVAGFACVLGYQLIVFAIFTKIFAIGEGLHPPNAMLERLYRYCTLEVGVICGLVMAMLGLGILGAAAWSWSSAGFGGLEPMLTMRQVIPAVLLMTLGTETIFVSFFLSVLGMRTGNRNS
jgi:glycosyltransferase involved in cell wall biosynthesis